MLSIEGITATYGPVQALTNVTLNIALGSFVAVVGPNGAGKTTLFKVISGVVPATQGRIIYEGQDLLQLPAYARARMGIAHVPEGRQVFKTMTVMQNLQTGLEGSRRAGDEREVMERIFELFPRLAERRGQDAGTLSGGEQQMLAIGRGLAARPKLLLLDEPSMGLAPAIADDIFETIERIHRDQGVTVVLVEQRVGEALQSCDYAYVFETGHVALEGTPELLKNNDRIRRAYLGM